jgi:hypothetical protein
MGPSTRDRTRWRLTDEKPSPRFLRWVRGTILVLWAVVLLVGVPRVVNQASEILQSPPSPSRSQALRDLAAEAVVFMVAIPFTALAIFGFGIVPRKNAAITGGPWFVSVWRTSRRNRRRRKD